MIMINDDKIKQIEQNKTKKTNKQTNDKHQVNMQTIRLCLYIECKIDDEN